MFCHDTSLIQGRSIFFFFDLFFYLFQNQNIYYNKNALSKPLKVIIYIHVALKYAFEKLTHKDATLKTEALLHMLFLEIKE